MSEAGGNLEEARRRLIERSIEDEQLRRKLLSDPKGTVEQELGVKMPEAIAVRVVEETPDTIYLVLPPKASGERATDLSDRELEAVAGGGLGTDGGYTCGGASTCYYVDYVCSS